MKTYLETQDTCILDGNNIPKHPENVAYQAMQREVSEGKAQLIPFTIEQTWESVRAIRNQKIEQILWEYDRYERQTRLGLSTTRSSIWMQSLDEYIQALADIPQRYAFDIQGIVWPSPPEQT